MENELNVRTIPTISEEEEAFIQGIELAIDINDIISEHDIIRYNELIKKERV